MELKTFNKALLATAVAVAAQGVYADLETEWTYIDPIPTYGNSFDPQISNGLSEAFEYDSSRDSEVEYWNGQTAQPSTLSVGDQTSTITGHDELTGLDLGTWVSETTSTGTVSNTETDITHSNDGFSVNASGYDTVYTQTFDSVVVRSYNTANPLDGLSTEITQSNLSAVTSVNTAPTESWFDVNHNQVWTGHRGAASAAAVTSDTAPLTSNITGHDDLTGLDIGDWTQETTTVSTVEQSTSDMVIDDNGLSLTSAGNQTVTTTSTVVEVVRSYNTADPLDGLSTEISTITIGSTVVTTATTHSDLDLNPTQASLTVTNADGATHGLTVGVADTVLSGGTSSTTLTLNDAGASFYNSDLDQTVEIFSLANSVGSNTAAIGANTAAISDLSGDLDDLEEELSTGIAISNAMEVLMPDVGKKFRLNIGGGFYNSESAIGITGIGRVGKDGNTAVYFGLGAGTNGDEVGGKIGVNFQW